jgi:ribosomal protein S18 acetylase RimI-like enzyme
MATLATSGGIEYSLFRGSDAEEMARLLGETFAKHDPPAVAVGITATEFQEFVGLLCASTAHQGLTIIARSATTGKMAGALFTDDSTTALPDGVERLSGKFRPVFDILGRLESAYRRDSVCMPGESAHLFLLGVAERFGGLGIGQQLVVHCIANAACKGYRRAVTEATNRRSQHIFRKAGFIERVRESYELHQFEGERRFASIAEQGGPILMDKVL